MTGPRTRRAGRAPVALAVTGVLVGVLAGCGGASTGGASTGGATTGSATGSTPTTAGPATTSSPTGATTSASPTAAAPTTPGGSSPTTAPGGGVDSTVPVGPASSLPAVPVGSPASSGGVTVTVSRVESVQGEARGPGQVAGPAVRLTLTIRSAAARSLDAVTVDLQSGGVSASPLSGPGVQPFPATVAAGGTATGVFVFALATSARADVTLRVTYDGGAPTVVFRGAV